MTLRPFLHAVAASLLATGFAGSPAAAQATITVETTDQHSASQCTLSDAIIAVNNGQPAGQCPTGLGVGTIQVPAGVYQLAAYAVDESGELTALPYITRGVRIVGEGPAATIIRRVASAPAMRLFKVQAPFEIEAMTLAGGSANHSRGGGAILAETFNVPVTATIRNVVFEGNAAPQGGALADTGFWYGPFATFTLDEVVFTGNSSTGGGGAIHLSPGSVINAIRSRFEDNTAAAWGGAIYNHSGGQVTIADSQFLRNISVQEGGAIHAASPVLTGVRFTDNQAGSGGGALYSYGGRPVITGSTFIGNQARRGGAVEVHGGSIEIDGSTFSGNHATWDGGAVYLDDRPGTSKLTNSTFSGNQTAGRGGGVYVYGGGLDVTNVTITGNVSVHGAGLALGWWGGSTVRIANSIVAGNHDPSGAALDVQADPAEQLISLGYNVIGTDAGTRGAFAQSGDQIGTIAAPLDAGLLPLADNGGPTLTHGLTAQSAALDAGNPSPDGQAACLDTDQRNLPRPGRGSTRCDAGAFEHQAPLPAHAVTLHVGIGGSVGGLPTGVCTSTCGAVVDEGVRLTLEATAQAGWAFEGWGGICAGTQPTCTFDVTAATSAFATFVDVPTPTATTLTASHQASVATQPVQFIAHVASAAANETPTGLVSFQTAGGAILGDALLDQNGRALLTTTQLPLGAHVVRAIYLGHADWTSSTATVSHQVSSAATTTQLATSGNPSIAGEVVTLTATVHAVAPATATPGGSVTFINVTAGVTLATRPVDAGGTATFVTSFATGTHAIKAIYTGIDQFEPSDAEIVQTATIPPPKQLSIDETIAVGDASDRAIVPPTVPTTLALAMTPGGTVRFSEPLILTATVASGSGVPTGPVTFRDAASGLILGTASLSGGQAALQLSTLPVGTHEIRATYADYDRFRGSTAAASVSVLAANTATSLTSNAATAVFGQRITLTVQVQTMAPATAVAAGNVSIVNLSSGVPLGSAPLNGAGAASLETTLPVGSASLRAVFTGAPGFAGSAVTLTQVVTRANTQVTVSAAPLPAVAGQPLTVTAQVTPILPGAGTPTGAVSFVDATSGLNLGVGVLDANATARVMTLALGPGPHTIVAMYAANGDFNGSSASHQVTVTQWPVKTLTIVEAIGLSDGVRPAAINTAAGSSVVVTLAGARLIFAHVTDAGMTSLVPIANPIAPARFGPTNPPVAYDISTTAQFSGLVTVCLAYPAGAVSPRMMHSENGQWVDRTTSTNTSVREVCGLVASLSPFAVFTPEPVAGRMNGDGGIDGGRQFQFTADERVLGVEKAKFQYRGAPAARRRDQFEATTIEAIVFWQANAVVFSGSGKWNGVAGYRFEVTAVDHGEPGRGRDRIAISIVDPHGAVVVSHDAAIDGGNIQSHRVGGNR